MSSAALGAEIFDSNYRSNATSVAINLKFIAVLCYKAETRPKTGQSLNVTNGPLIDLSLQTCSFHRRTRVGGAHQAQLPVLEGSGRGRNHWPSAGVHDSANAHRSCPQNRIRNARRGQRDARMIKSKTRTAAAALAEFLLKSSSRNGDVSAR